MTVSSTELRSWTTPGAQDAAARTYNSVKAILESSSRLAGFTFEVFLQGSYANATNTRGDSDVDIVAMLTSSYMPELTQLSPVEQRRYEARRIPATTTVDDFRHAVHLALADRYEGVEPKKKCLKIPRQGSLLDADVVPCQQHRRYFEFPETGSPRWIEGISIKPLTGPRIVNYPKEHRTNGQDFNQETGERYKPTVRQVKRLRRAAVDKGLVGRDQAPGYLLECMVFNAPDYMFYGDEAIRVGDVLRWLDGHTAEQLAATIWSCDKIHKLFGDDPGGHNQYTAKRTLASLVSML
jgi:hypothetical protein